MIVKTARAAGYVRVSQVGGRGGDSFLSPDLQRERIEAWAQYRQADVVDWYVDLDVSGRSGVLRPEFERLMSDARAGRFDVVAVYRLTRFGRSVKDTAARSDELRQLGVGLVSVTEDIDTTTATGGLVQNVLFALAEFESERIGEEWRSVHATRRRRGLPHITRSLFGYRVERGVPVAPEPAEARAVRHLYERRLAGDSWTRLADYLEREGFRSPRGVGPRFGQTTIAGILRNPAYAGLVRAGDDLVDAQHEAIVSRDLWDAVQASWPRQRRLHRHASGLASGLVVCAGCDYHMSRGVSNSRQVYRCTAHAHTRPCPSPAQIAQPRLDAHVEAAFLRHVDPRHMPRRGRATRGGRAWGQKARQLQARHEDLTRAVDRLSDERYLLGSLDHAEYERQVTRLLEQRARVDRDLGEAQGLAAASRPVTLDWSVHWPQLPVDRKRQMLRAAIAEVRVSKGRGDVSERVEVAWL